MESASDPAVITAAVVAGVILYIYTAFCLYRIAKNLGVRHAWFAWIPILNAYLWCKICGKGILWTILFFVPVVGLVIYVMLCVKLAHACGRGTILGVLFIFPLVDLVIFWVFVKSSEKRGAAGRVGPPYQGDR